MVVLRTIQEQLENIFRCPNNVLILFYLKIKMGDKKMFNKIIEKIINLLFSKYLLKQKQLNESFNNNVQLLNTHRTRRKSKK